MPYDARNPNMNPGHEHKFADVNDCLNKIATSFKEWELWHGESEVCATLIDYRGPSRFHQQMQKRAYCDCEAFRKCVADRPFSHKTMIDMATMPEIIRTAQYGKPQFIQHLDMWDKWLGKTRMMFSGAALYLADCEEITLYQKVCCYTKQIENEMWAVEILHDRLIPDELNHPDAKSVFKKLHIYFDPKNGHYDGGMIDFDL